jgi:hypothetical protein
MLLTNCADQSLLKSGSRIGAQPDDGDRASNPDDCAPDNDELRGKISGKLPNWPTSEDELASAPAALAANLRYNPAVTVHRQSSPPAASFTKGEINRADALLSTGRSSTRRVRSHP